MIDKHRIVVCTPAGRREYLALLLAYVLRHRNVVDEFQLWLNTTLPEDVAYIRQQGKIFRGFITIVEPSTDVPIIPGQPNGSIFQFFRGCIQPNTAYIRMDDDVVFVDERAIETLVLFRIENPQYFLVYGNIVNNAICGHLHQRIGAVDRRVGTVGYSCFDAIGWTSREFAEHNHRCFLQSCEANQLDRFKSFERWELNLYERTSINVISWLGEEFQQFDGKVGNDEEDWLSHAKPAALGKMNCICGGALFSHYAFHTQREHLRTTNILAQYKDICDVQTASMADADKLLYALHLILTAALADLRDRNFLTHVIRRAGLHPDWRQLYGSINSGHQNRAQGAWQIPDQLADLMLYLQRFHIDSYLDVGVFHGWTCSLLTAVLLRFNADLKVTAIDPENWWHLHPQIAAFLPIEYRHETTDANRSRAFDFVFIDGNHEYRHVFHDYQNVGRQASVCAFHDCNDEFVRGEPRNDGGVPKLWHELKAQGIPYQEYFMHPDGRDVMGIGVLVNVASRAR